MKVQFYSSERGSQKRRSFLNLTLITPYKRDSFNASSINAPVYLRFCTYLLDAYGISKSQFLPIYNTTTYKVLSFHL